MTLNATGERMVLEKYHSSIEDYVIYLTHIASYRWVADYVRGKRVLDFGCGSGYGSAEMAESAALVEGVDVAEDAVSYASETFRKPNLSYTRFDPNTRVPFDDNSFDVVTSFQVIEHVEDLELYVREAKRVLVPGGKFIVITPDRAYRLFSWQKPWNRWHIDEFSADRLERLIAGQFEDVEMLAMSGDPELCQPELDRCRKLKWTTIPFTLGFYPMKLRVALLNILHGIKGRSQNVQPKKEFDLDESQVRIGPGLEPSLNLVAIATRD